MPSAIPLWSDVTRTYSPKNCSKCGVEYIPTGTHQKCCVECRYKRHPGQVAMGSSEHRRKIQAAHGIPDGKKRCVECDQVRLLKFFPKRRPNDPSCISYQSRCKTCYKNYQRSTMWTRVYSISLEEYMALKDLQGGRCAICQVASGLRKALSVDHDHQLEVGGKVTRESIRGLLCSKCNHWLGTIRDDPEAGRRVIEYLTDPPARRILRDS